MPAYFGLPGNSEKLRRMGKESEGFEKKGEPLIQGGLRRGKLVRAGNENSANQGVGTSIGGKEKPEKADRGGRERRGEGGN